VFKDFTQIEKRLYTDFNRSLTEIETNWKWDNSQSSNQ
jgi:hypothetical protein